MATFLLEVGTEELPASFVSSAIAQWKAKIPQSLEENLLTYDSLEVYGTPRRLAVVIKALPSQQPDREEEIKGPPVKAAFKDGKPTKAAEGFARKQGISIEDFTTRDTPKGEFIFVEKKIPGRATQEILTELILPWITGLEGKRFMRWADGDFRFSRPIRWLVSLLDEEILPVEIVSGSSKISSDRLSSGHWVLHPEPVTIPHAEDYVKCLKSAYIEVDPQGRSTNISQQVEQAAKELGGWVEIDLDLLAEVTNLVEYPTAVIGKFEEEYLALPPEVITTVMISHQRYFPVTVGEKDSNLLPNFITISNGNPEKSEIISAGNGRVIRARLADAKFFYDADLQKPLEEFFNSLERVTFQEDLGSVKAKVERFSKIAQTIAEQLELDLEQQQTIQRTALLCKADLETQMVDEFPELQGVMGQKYALAGGESPEVANGIFEHYLPRGAEDNLPPSLTGQVVGIADRLDTLVSIFGLGMIPTGSSDPFALRRAANAIINITWHGNLSINLSDLLTQFSTEFTQSFPDKESPLTALQDFFMQRIRTLLQDELKVNYDLVNAVLGENDSEYTQRALTYLLDVRDRATFMQAIRNNKTLEAIYETVNRSTRLAAKGDLDTQQLDPENLVNPELFEKSSEQSFYDALVQLVPTTKTSQTERNYQLLVDALVKIAPTVSKFFDGEDSVLVMAEDVAVKRNRLNLLALLRNHGRVLADFGAIVKQ